MRFFEEYQCGCVSKHAPKKRLTGYCATHGKDVRAVYRADWMPADKRTIETVREVRRITQPAARETGGAA